jgi:hypothetical protein
MNNETTKSIVERIVKLEEEKASLLNSIEKEAIRLIQESIGVIQCRPKGYEFGPNLGRAMKELEAAIHGTFNRTSVASGDATKTRQRINKATKDQLFAEIVSEFRSENSADQMPFTELTDRLKAKGHSPKSVSVFFRNQLDGKPTEGATRNKTLLVGKLNDEPRAAENGCGA